MLYGKCSVFVLGEPTEITVCSSRRKPRGRRRSAAGAHRPAKPIGEAMGDGYRRLRAATGSYGQFAFLCTGSCLRCRKNDFFGICGVGMVSHILRYHFAPFIRFEIIKSTASRDFFSETVLFRIIFWNIAKVAIPIYGMSSLHVGIST